jgi:sec-independent protein translocase protein TatB
MLFDLSWAELLLIGAIALIVIGPKELPNTLRIAGFWVRKARSLSREFQSSVEQMIREAELDDVRKQLKKATEFDVEREFQKTVDPDGELGGSIKAPQIPDHSGEPEKPGTAAGAAEALPAPGENAGAEPGRVAEEIPPPVTAPDDSAPASGEPSSGAPEPVREPAPSKSSH